MKQEINFLTSLPQTSSFIEAKWIARIIVMFLLLLTLISLGVLASQIQGYVSLDKIRNESIQTINAFQIIANTHPLLASETPLESRIKQLEKKLAQEKSAYESITQIALRYGFSNYLKELAQVVPKGLWLNEIMIDQVTRHMSLAGYMLEPMHVSLFLDALQKSSSFEGTTFNIFYVKAVPDKALIEFKVTNMKGSPKK